MQADSQQPVGGLTTPGVSRGIITIKEEEYLQLVQAAALVTARAQGSGSSEPIPIGSSGAPIGVGDESPSMPAMSSASESGSPVTRRQLYRTKRGLINVSEPLREKLRKTKQALEEETQRRQQAAPTLVTRELLEGRIEMLTQAFHSAIGVLREDINKVMPLTEKVEEMEGHLRFVASSAHEAMNHVQELEQRPESDWSDWSLLDHEEFQELKTAWRL